jgi:hypothetical protein
MRTVIVTRTTTETIQVPDVFDLSIGLGDSGPGGDPPHAGFITVDGVQLCTVAELSPAAAAAFATLRAEIYQRFLVANDLVST